MTVDQIRMSRRAVVTLGGRCARTSIDGAHRAIDRHQSAYLIAAEIETSVFYGMPHLLYPVEPSRLLAMSSRCTVFAAYAILEGSRCDGATLLGGAAGRPGDLDALFAERGADRDDRLIGGGIRRCIRLSPKSA